MKAKQYAWVHLLSNGRMNHRPSYYGGWEHIDRSKYNWADKRIRAEQDSFMADLKQHGVNWDKTDNVQSELYSEFRGTFCDSGESIYLEGWITLNNGRKEFWCAPNVDAADIFSQMAMVSEYEKKVKEIFGE